MRYAHIEQQSVSRKATMVIDRFNGDGDGDWLRQWGNGVINYYCLINYYLISVINRLLIN
jgi:hypothetical protein